jgi:hypothetical protein
MGFLFHKRPECPLFPDGLQVDAVKNARFLVAALPVLLLTCAPPFDLAVSQSARVAQKLTHMGQVGPMDPNSIGLNSSSSQGNEDVVFFPEKDGAGGITLQAGFLYAIDQAGQSVSFVASNGGGYARYGSSQFLGPVSTDPYPNQVLQTAKSLHSGVGFQFVDSLPSNNTYVFASGDPVLNTLTTTPPVPMVNLVAVTPFNVLGAAQVIGLSIYPDPNPTFDWISVLIQSQTFPNSFLEGRFQYSAGTVTTPGIALRGTTAYDLSPFAATPANRVLYYYDPVPAVPRSYVSVWSSPMAQGAWSTWVWTDSVPSYSRLSGIDHRIDALLTTGELFSTEGNTCRVYDPNTPTGNLEAEFTLGDLRFVGEVYVAGVPTMLFSHAVWFNRQVSFDVYSIPTSQLKSLAQ